MIIWQFYGAELSIIQFRLWIIDFMTRKARLEANTTVEIGRHTHFDCTAHRSTGKIQNWTNIGLGFLPFLPCFSLFDAVLVCCVYLFHVLLLHENWVDPTGGDQRWPKRENMGMGQKLLYVYIYTHNNLLYIYT